MLNDLLPKGGPTLDRRSAIKLMLGATTILAATSGTPSVALADTEEDLSEAQAQYDEAQKQLSQIADEYEALSVRQSDTLEEIEGITSQISTLEDEIDKRSQELEAKKSKLSETVSGEYKDGGHGVLDVVLGSESVEELIGNIRSYDKITQANADLIEQVKDERAQLQSDQDELEQQKSELEAQRATQEEQLDQMRDKQAEAQDLVDGLDQKVKDLIEQRDAELLAAQQEAKKAAEERAAAEKKAQEEAEAAQAKADAEAKAKAEQEAAAAAASSSDATDDGASTSAADDGESSSATGASSTDSGTTSTSSTSSTSSSTSTSSTTADAPTGSAAAVVASCKSTPSPGGGLCAAWVSNVFVNAGYGFIGGNACDMYNSYATYSSKANLKPGMIVAVSTHPHTSAGRIYGHIGIYIGGGQLMDNIGYIRTTSIDSWISYYGATVTPRWGWLGGIVLG